MKSLVKFAAAVALMFGTNVALAQVVNTDDNTDAGTVIGNTASVTYDIGGIAQEAVSDTASFRVDRAILVTVANIEGASGAPGATGRALEFTVTNDSNATLDFLLSAEQPTTDDFDVSGVSYYMDADSNDANEGIYDTGDTPLTGGMINDLGEGQQVTIFVVSAFPGGASDPGNSPADAEQSEVILIATAYETDGTTIVVETNTASTNENPTEEGTPAVTDVDGMFMDTVFGDTAGDATLYDVDGAGTVDTAGDGAEDGYHSATGTYTIATADISVAKTSRVLDDPFNGTDFPKAIPGATVQYCIEITNGSANDADNVTVTDNVPVNTQYVAGSMLMDTDCDPTAGSVPLDDDDTATGDHEDDTNSAIDRGDFSGVVVAGGQAEGDEGVITTVDAVLPAGETTTTIFDVVIR